MRPAPLILLLALVCANTTLAAAASAPVDLPGWMSGHWCIQQGGEQIEEQWLGAAGGMMVGASRTITPKRTQFEFLRIELAGGVPTYVAQPNGGKPTSFQRTDGGADWVRFENPAHDFPQRIEYRRNGDALLAEIAGPGEDGAEFKIPFEFKRCED